MVQLIESMKLCINCLRSGHAVAKCSSRNRCSFCKKEHHTLLHQDTSGSKTHMKDKLHRSLADNTETTLTSM